MQQEPIELSYHNKKYKFYFLTGASLCISKKAAEMMQPWTVDNTFMKVAQELGVPDDVTMGFILNAMLGINLTQWDSMRHPYERLPSIEEGLLQQVSIVYNPHNVVNINSSLARFSETADPTRFHSLHCLIKPDIFYCNQ